MNASHDRPFRDVTVPQLVAAQGGSRPAVVAEDGRLTYAELTDRATGVAYALRAAGAGPESVIAVCLPPSTDLIVALYGVLLAGAAYLPVDPQQPDARSYHLLADSRAAAVLVGPATRDRFPAAGTPRYELSDLKAPSGALEPLPVPAAGDLAYVIYTSGSTGRPKGVAVQHGSFRGIVDTWARLMDLRPGDRGSQVAALGFDATILEIWPILAAGGTLVLAGAAARVDPDRTLDFLRTEVISAAFLPTPLAEAVLARTMPDGLRLRVLGVGGDLLHAGPEPRHRFTVVNAYGPTECTVVATAGVVPVGVTRPPSIGRPVNGAEVRIVGPDDRDVPPGEIGELQISGDCLARGYLHRPDLTADRFRPDPRPGHSGGRLYRTGDLGWADATGAVEFAGRTDDQVKIRGHRIELGEIESCLLGHPQVGAAAVMVIRSTAAEPQLVGYVVPAGSVAPTPAGLTAYLQDRLMDAMVPQRWTTLDALPRSAAGKVDRPALPDPPPMPSGEEPCGPIEEYIAGEWAQLLGRRPGRTDDFFECGGHSLLATQLAARVRVALELPALPLNALFQAPTVAALAGLATTGDPASDRPARLAEAYLLLAGLSAEDQAALLTDD